VTKDGGSYLVKTKFKYYNAFLRALKRPALPPPVGISPFAQKSSAIKGLSYSDSQLLVSFIQKYEKRDAEKSRNPSSTAPGPNKAEGNDELGEHESAKW
jgi:hypothetical protein